MTTDPLLTLGPDLFVEILSHLPASALLSSELVSRSWNDCAQAYSCGLWRRASLREHVEPSDVVACDSLASRGKWTVDEHDRRPLATDVNKLLEPPTIHEWASRTFDSPAGHTPLTPLDTPTLDVRVNWRYVCQNHIELQKAWSTARCRLGWITSGSNSVWRIKSTVEQDVILCTSRIAGLSAIDRLTSKSIFCIQGLEGYAHLEAGRGFAVFDTPGHVQPVVGVQFDALNTNTALEVWRNAEARSRSDLPYVGISSVAESAISYTHSEEFQPGVPGSPLPRGHMEHFRTVQPPDRCLAFRLHVDGADSDNPRAVLAAAGRDAIFIWQLEENRPMNRIERGVHDRGRPSYVELDDEFVFVCMERQMHVYSRKSQKYLASFPPAISTARDAGILAFPLSLSDDFKAISDEERKRRNPEKTADGVPAPIARAVVDGYYRGDEGFDVAVSRGVAMHGIRLQADDVDDIEYGFTAVHYTPTDLICIARSGAVFIVKNYASVFHAVQELPETQRSTKIAENTIIIGLGTTIRHLTTYRHHIAICTSFNVILFDGEHIPDIRPESSEPVPSIRAHVLLGNHPQAMKMSSCLQADARSVYLTYWATGEMDATGGSNPANVSFPPDSALEGFGMCIKAWTFGKD